MHCPARLAGLIFFLLQCLFFLFLKRDLDKDKFCAGEKERAAVTYKQEEEEKAAAEKEGFKKDVEN